MTPSRRIQAVDCRLLTVDSLLEAEEISRMLNALREKVTEST